VCVVVGDVVIVGRCNIAENIQSVVNKFWIVGAVIVWFDTVGSLRVWECEDDHVYEYDKRIINTLISFLFVNCCVDGRASTSDNTYTQQDANNENEIAWHMILCLEFSFIYWLRRRVCQAHLQRGTLFYVVYWSVFFFWTEDKRTCGSR
jgi:hypothetical protein